MVVLIDKKLKSSTLIETLVASVIIMIVFTVFSAVWVSLMQSHSKRISISDDQFITEVLYKYKTHNYMLPHEIELENKSAIIELVSKKGNTITVSVSLTNDEGNIISKKVFTLNEYD